MAALAVRQCAKRVIQAGARANQGVAAPAAAAAAENYSCAAEKTSYGGLKDEDRIFTNLYGKHDPFLKVCGQRRTQERKWRAGWGGS